MHAHAAVKYSSSVTVYRHPLAYIPTLVLDTCLCGIAVAYGMATPATLTHWTPLICMVFVLISHIWAWCIFKITFSPGWIVIRESRFGFPLRTAYSIHTLHALRLHQGLLGMLCDSGTLEIDLPKQTRTFRLLTSYTRMRYTID